MNIVQMLAFWILAVTAQLAVLAVAILLLQSPATEGQQKTGSAVSSGLHYAHIGGEQNNDLEWDLFSGSCG